MQVEEMSDIKRQVLEKYNDIFVEGKSNEDIQELIRCIGVMLLNSKIIFTDRKNEKHLIKPLFVEGYLKDDDEKIQYDDCFIHKNKNEQKGDEKKPFRFYLHYTTCEKRMGLDVAIGTKPNVRFSYLIKVSKCDDECRTRMQSKTGEFIHALLDDDKNDHKEAVKFSIRLENDRINKWNYSQRVLSNKSKKSGIDYKVAVFNSEAIGLEEDSGKLMDKDKIKPQTIYRKYK